MTSDVLHIGKVISKMSFFESLETYFILKTSESADLKDGKKASRTSSMDEQIFDVSILTKSCSFKKEKIQKYKLFAALIGTHGKTDWKEINANLQGKTIYLS